MANGVAVSERTHLCLVPNGKGGWEQRRIAHLRGDEGGDVLVVPRSQSACLVDIIAAARAGDVAYLESFGAFVSAYDPTTRTKSAAVPVDVDQLLADGHAAAWAAHVVAVGDGPDAFAKLDLARDSEAAYALLLALDADEAASVYTLVRQDPGLHEAFLAGLSDRRRAEALLAVCDPAQLADDVIEVMGWMPVEYAPLGMSVILADARITPSDDWSASYLYLALRNPNITDVQAAVALEACPSLRIDTLGGHRGPWQAGVARRALDVEVALLTGGQVPPELLADHLGSTHALVAAGVVAKVELSDDIVEVALGAPLVVRQALAKRLGGTEHLDAQRQLASDHDVATRAWLAERATDPEVIALLAASPERPVRDRLVRRGYPVADPVADPVTDAGADPGADPGAMVRASVPARLDRQASDALWATLRGKPAYGQVSEKTAWGGPLAVTSRVVCEDSDDAVAARAQAVALRTRALANGTADTSAAVQCCANAADVLLPDADVAMVAITLSELWKDSGNHRVPGADHDWMNHKLAEVHGVEPRFDRWEAFVGDPTAPGADGRSQVEHRAAMEADMGLIATQVLRAAADEARGRIAAAGVTHVPVTRTMTLTRAEAQAAGLTVVGRDHVDGGVTFTSHPTGLVQAPVSSWTMGDAEPLVPADDRHDDDRVYVTIRAMVAAEDVAGFGGAGLAGVFHWDTGTEFALEHEVLVLDRDRPCEILAVSGA